MSNYSEEEERAIDILTNEIADIVVGEYCTHCKICGNENRECYYSKAIGTVCSIIIRQQKEIKELKEKNKKQFLNCEKRINELEYKQLNYISEDKIRDKIYELEKEIEEKQEHGLDLTLIHEHEIDTDAIIQVLNELLEE